MAAAGMCPLDSFAYNSTSGAILCACAPGRYLTSEGTCSLAPDGDFVYYSSLDEQSTFFTTVLSFGVVRRFTELQAVLLWITAAALILWLLFCAAVRFGPLRDGASVWFRIRWWISRLDIVYATRHWLSDRTMVTKRKTELGGTCSIASWILFIGLLSSLLYHIIAKRTIDVNRIRPFHTQDLLLFDKDMEFNVTTISSMSCSQLRGLDKVVSGTPGYIDHRVDLLSSYADYFCLNTSNGPTITIKCNSCRFPLGLFYVSWQFVSLPRNPASAVAFQFNLTTKNHRDGKGMSFASGIARSGYRTNDIPKTFRGPNANILKIHLFPQIYRNSDNLSIIQLILNDFLPGSFYTETSQLKTSLEKSGNDSISTLLSFNFLSDYIVEVDKEKILGPVAFLAAVGGVYAISGAIFLVLMVLCERRIKKFRNEDNEFHRIMRRKKAQHNWDKVRKYVTYTWGSKGLDGENASIDQLGGIEMWDCLCGTGNVRKKSPQSRNDSKNKHFPQSTSSSRVIH